MKPLIGITSLYLLGGKFNPVTGKRQGENRNIVDGTYIDFVVKAGGIPVLVPHFDSLELMDMLLTRLDGIILAGGLDVNPQTYGQRIKGYCQNLVPSHDEEELCLARKAYAAGKCILGICRGAQILNVAMGGALYQDLEKEGNFESHALYQVPAVFSYA